MKRYAMGIDYGTLSARTVLVDIDTEEEVASAVMEYPHGVISDTFLDGKKLPPDYALQHPADYLEVLDCTVTKVLQKSKVPPEEIVGIGVDFTASTILPVTQDGTPLCFLKEFQNRPHSYVKLWKHHAAQKEAEEINRIARERREPWLKRYGGIVSSEWMLPKVWQILKEDEGVYDKTYRFIEAADWLVWQLTGKETHSACTAGFKALWSKKDGYPCSDFFKALDPRMEHIIGDKISAEIIPMNQAAGVISTEAERRLGLHRGTPVAPAVIDAHAALPAVGICDSGKLLMIIGTSTCHILLGDKEVAVPGISGVVEDGIVVGSYAYEAGQACVGDSFDWFVKNCVPRDYIQDAERQGETIHSYLKKKAEKLEVGESGLLALDWWNGNRTPYVNGDLRGMILGLSISTKPEEIYRALIEATAFGTKWIIDLYEEQGVQINEIYAAGGIAEKDAFLMQIYADVTGREIRIADTAQACAYGSAVFGASVGENGYGSLAEASKHMAKVKKAVVCPNSEHTKAYQELYGMYRELATYFGEQSDVLKQLSQRRK